MTTPHASLEGWTAIVIVSAEGDRMQSSTPTALHAVAGVLDYEEGRGAIAAAA